MLPFEEDISSNLKTVFPARTARFISSQVGSKLCGGQILWLHLLWAGGLQLTAPTARVLDAFARPPAGGALQVIRARHQFADY